MFKEARTSPSSLDLSTFAFQDGDFILVRWREGHPYAVRLWDRSNVEDLFKLVPSLEEQVGRGFPIFPEASDDPNDPLADIRNRLRGLL